MTLGYEDVVAALIPDIPPSGAVSLSAGVVTGPRLVKAAGDTEGQLIDGATGAVGQKGYVLSVDDHRYWLPFNLASYTATNRYLTLGPDGDFEPILELIRDRPSYLAGALMYLAGSSSTTELAWAIQDNGVTQATLRLTKNGLLLQDNVGSAGSRYFAYQADVTALQAATADTGPQTLTPLSGFTGSLQYRRANGKTELSGRVTRTAGSWPAGAYTVFANLPAIARPAALRTLSVNDRAGRNYLLAAYPNGDLAVHPGQSTSQSAEAELDSVNHFR